MILSVGDVVRIKSKEQLLEISHNILGTGSLSIRCESRKSSIPFNRHMFQYCGQIAKIVKIIGINRYYIDLDQHNPWIWVEEFFDFESLIL